MIYYLAANCSASSAVCSTICLGFLIPLVMEFFQFLTHLSQPHVLTEHLKWWLVQMNPWILILLNFNKNIGQYRS